MEQLGALDDAEEVAARIAADVGALPVPNTPSVRTVRRRYSRLLEHSGPEFVLLVARALLGSHGRRWPAYELIQNHGAAFQSIGADELEEFGEGIDSWGSVDAFARVLAGPAWLAGQVTDELIHAWACSRDRWWRRAALVSTVALNIRSQGGTGDARRTLAVCRLLVNDRDDMVVKAMSWALRALVAYDAAAVRTFLREHRDVLASRVRREVNNKLQTGLKNPRRKRG